MKIIVREIFVAKPGMAGKLARLFKKMMKNYPEAKVMTDLVGDYNTVVMEMPMDSLAEFEKQMEDFKSGKPDPNVDPEVMEEMKNYTEMYTHGKREIFQVVE